MSAALKQVNEYRYSRFHRAPYELDIPNEEFVGPRGGRKIPLEIVWRPNGTGLGASVFRICGCTVLYPSVRYHNGNGKPRIMWAGEWVKLTKKGTARRLKGEEIAEFELELKACNEKKARIGGRVAEIVTSIVENGGTVRISGSL